MDLAGSWAAMNDESMGRRTVGNDGNGLVLWGPISSSTSMVMTMSLSEAEREEGEKEALGVVEMEIESVDASPRGDE